MATSSAASPASSSWFQPDFRSWNGCTGDRPVPSGHWPDGTGRTLELATDPRKSSRSGAFPSGGSPLGTDPVACATHRKGHPYFGIRVQMIAFRHPFSPSLTAQLHRVCELDTPAPGNTLAPMNATQDQVTILREVAGSLCLWGAGRNGVASKAERTIASPIPFAGKLCVCQK